MGVIDQALAAAPGAAPPGGGITGQLVMLGGFLLIFWFLIWRPQQKRAREHKQLLANLTKGDEVVTSGGIIGKVTVVTDDFLTLNVGSSVELRFQKSAVAAALPKGTMKTIQ